MIIRMANTGDIPVLMDLLAQILELHHEGRPDIFRANAVKYTSEQLQEILLNKQRPIFVAVDDEGCVQGYAFCIFMQSFYNSILTPIKTLYIDDLCVDKKHRGQGIGRELYEYVKWYAKGNECYNLTLNVWACNKDAMHFYEKMGLGMQKAIMEQIL